jgi:hypothetical protein
MILGIDFRHRNVEGISQTVFDASNNATFVLETFGFANQQSHTDGADDHTRQSASARSPA